MADNKIGRDGAPMFDVPTLVALQEARESLPDPGVLVRLVIKLLSDLRLAELEPENPKLPTGMAAAEAALRAMAEFIHGLDTKGRGLNTPLTRFLLAIGELAEGRAPTLFQQMDRSSGGRPRKRQSESVVTGFAAKAVTLQMEAGRSLEEATRRAADAINGGRGRRKAVTAKMVQNWRARIMDGKASQDAISAYWERLPELGAIPWERAERLLRQLKERPAKLGW